MVLQSDSQIKLLESNGALSLSIAAAAVVLLVFLVLLYFNKRWFSNSSINCYDEHFTLPHTTRQCLNKSSSNNGKSNWQQTQLTKENQSIHINIHSHIKNERELENAYENTLLVRNRGSTSSSSESTTASTCEDDANVVRQRDIARYARAFSLPEEQMPLAVSRDNLDDQFSDIHSAFSDSMSGIIGKCGLLEVSFAYDAPVKKMTIHVLQARDIPATDRGRPSYTQIQIVLLPGKKQKQKSKVRNGDNPQYMESFLFHRITPEDVNNMSVRFRLYGCEKIRRQRLIGECIISFANVNLQLQSNIWVPLEPRANMAINMMACEVLSLCQSDSTGSLQSMQHGGVPELLVGLSYNGITGRLSVEIIKGSNFRHVTATKAPDTYVKLRLMSCTGQEIARSKTTVRRAQPNPLFKEMFMYQVVLYQLCDVTLFVMVYKKTLKKRQRLGWFMLGQTSSGDEERSHWKEMAQCNGDQLSRWHVLLS
ncbi:synaptotagmin-16 [Planococcus citri]|uniref:synaptotagmin-16 n=1 Tax=Planococcus citri TaxID=170843 RepID=UPI0031F9342B